MTVAEKTEALETLAREIGALVYGIREVPDPIFEIICDGSKPDALDRFISRFYHRLGALRGDAEITSDRG